ncbi:DUF2834 domain-containing protein [Pseudoduganella sp. FT93W]|uniref:DUF2834 domain-containing protein n=1 Tax=Duganella fentianensis TaxID=2692177 RepID=A0A845HWB4_9BURK|nr:DUF2834 domain-containing protein [Duganella fentianensis]MYN45400.1 DUF2834 domain-containing protein [Duganella fentianensis]
MHRLYLLLCLLGSVLPLAAFMPWLASHGLALNLLLAQILEQPVAAFAWADVLVSALALLAFMWHEQRQQAVRGVWWAVASLFLVGVSLALPLYLYLRAQVARPAR